MQGYNRHLSVKVCVSITFCVSPSTDLRPVLVMHKLPLT